MMAVFQSPIFQGIDEGEWADMNALTRACKTVYEKGTVILAAGERTPGVGLVLRGSVNVESIDLWGNRSILSNVPAGQVFAETYALCGEPLLVDAVAAEPCEVLFLNTGALLRPENGNRSWYLKLSGNLLRATARKNLVLSNRIFCTSAKTIRGRLLTYLSALSVQQGSTVFHAPFNRQQMADYLNVDRSALSKELCKMRDEGLIAFRKNAFRLLQPMDKA